jgi:hypothetical protein
MLKQVLESVNEMLNQALDGAPDIPIGDLGILITYVKCAQILLKKTIDGMEPDTILITNGTDEPKEYTPTKDKSKPFGGEDDGPVPSEEMYELVKGLDNTLDKIIRGGQEIPPNTPMEVDGKKVTYGQAKGKPFTTGRLL